MSDVQRKHTRYMHEALALAAGAALRGDVPVGCVIVKDDEIVGRGANEIERTGNPTRHAEVVAIEQATQHCGEKFLEDATLYVTLEPCAMCAGAILLARIPNVVYGAPDEKSGACNSVFEILHEPRLNHKAVVRSGVLADECATILTEFFSQRRADRTADAADTGAAHLRNTAALYLVPTPIGNMDDMTLRAVKTLREVDAIYCEDTRRTAPLLRKFDVPKKPLLSYHEHNEQDRAVEIAAKVQSGQRIALVTDAGMPGISDPGYRAVQRCTELGVNVIALPGASAMVTAVAASGLPTNRIVFSGFPPQKKGRAAFIADVAREHGTVVLYESPYRIETLLEELVEAAGASRRIVVARELTKVHEEYLRGTVAEVLHAVRNRGGLKGEIVVMVGGLHQPGEA